MKGSRGQAAVFGVFLILLFSAYGIVRVMSVALGSSSVSYGVNAREALYAAETGLEYAIEEIRADKPDAGNIEGLLVGSAEVSVTNQGDTLLTALARTTEPELSKTVRLRIDVSSLPAAFRSVLYTANALNLNMNANATIDGSILFDGRNLILHKNLTLSNMTIYAPRAASVKNNGTSTFIRHNYMYENEAPDDFPLLTTSYYQSYVNNSHGYASVGPVIDIPTDLADYTDRVIYRYGNLTIRAPVTGPGIVTASGTITIQSGASLGPDVQIIAGGVLTIANAPVTSGAKIGSLLFSMSRINLNGGSILRASLLTPGNLVFTGTVVQEGLCYARGSLNLNGTYTIKGSVVVWKVSQFKGNGILSFDESNLDVTGIPGLGGRPQVRRIAWEEN
jgi:hypothetical protein